MGGVADPETDPQLEKLCVHLFVYFFFFKLEFHIKTCWKKSCVCLKKCGINTFAALATSPNPT